MACLVWLFFVFLYVFLGITYVYVSPFNPLGAMQYYNLTYPLLFTVFIGSAGVFSGYFFLVKIKLPTLKYINDRLFLKLCSILYLGLSLIIFFLGVQYYGGYFSFISTPYTPIYDGSAVNQIQDTLVSTSGLLANFSILSFLSANKFKFKPSIIIILALFVLISIFIQGRRESLVLLVMSLISYRLLNSSFDFKLVIKVSIWTMLLLLLAGLGLYLRESSTTSGGNIFSAIFFAVLFETHFTLATLANEIQMHLVDKVPYAGAITLMSPILFIVPSFLFDIIGLSKQDFFTNTEVKLYEDKGGAFIFSEGFHALGYSGVFIHGFILGLLLILFYRASKRTGLVIYHFPLVSLILVAMRKDITYGVKYISLMYMLMFVFCFFYSIVIKKRIN